MSWILVRKSDGDRKRSGAYVSQPGSASSYTRDIRSAQRFATREEAERNSCGNEYPVTVEQAVGGF